MKKEERLKKASYKEIADFLGVSVSAVSQYKPKKLLLMKIGLARYKEYLGKNIKKSEQ